MIRRVAAPISRGVGCWLIAAIFGVLIYASTAPSQLYRVYEQKWHFSATTVTAVFSVYARSLATLAAPTEPAVRDS